MDLARLLKESAEAKAEDFLRVVKNATELLCSEEGQIGNQTISGKLVKLAPVGEALVVGDLHGDIDSLKIILEASGFLNRTEHSKDAVLVFLGDYGDRGEQSIDVYFAVLSLKLAFPKQVVLLRGNHEGPRDLRVSPHDLPLQLQRRFKEKSDFVNQKIRELFDCLYNAVLVEERFLMVHGGVPSKIRDEQDIAQASTLHPKKSFLEELLWSDPDETVARTCPSQRGAGRIFGKAVTEEVLARLNVQVLIRGHEPAYEGFAIGHEGRILTLFSRKGAPYYNANGAYLDVPLSEHFENAQQLLQYVHKF